jgi:hypothetical protein
MVFRGLTSNTNESGMFKEYASKTIISINQLAIMEISHEAGYVSHA